VIEWQAGCGEGGELRLDLLRQLAPHAWPQEGDARGDHIVAKTAISADETRHAIGWQHRPAIDQHEMEADAEAWQPAGPRHGVVHRRARDHQARRAQYAFAMRLLDRLVDRDVRAEIIGGDDQLLQAMDSLRRRRKSKNSTPSRSRRFIMSKSRSISATIDPILRGRK